jgi:hypothetical protein
MKHINNLSSTKTINKTKKIKKNYNTYNYSFLI